jgi:hypothetical protein
MPNFTKGRWAVVDTPSVRGIFNGCSVIASDQVEDAIIAMIAEDVPNPEANAHLIAAAPDMYEALINIRKELRASGNWEALDYGWPANRKAIDSAIAKAEGRDA